MRSMVLSARLVIPMTKAVLCTGCESVYPATDPHCPACGARLRLDLFKMLDWSRA